MTSEQKDIAATLRDTACCWRGDDPIAIELRQAADEIERLRAELVSKADELAATVRELRKVEAERDEARGNAILAEHLLWDARCDICYEIAAAKTNLPEGHPDTVVEAKAEADRRGWDCFKENKR